MKFAASAVLLFPSALALAFAAPPRVEDALRARVNEFYSLIIQHKTRAAEALVARDTKDYYYDSQKPDMESFEIDKITYGPGFKTAEVAINAKMHMLFPGAGPQTVPMKFPSTWKLENGKWCWYIDRSHLAQGPFGEFRPGPGAGGPKEIVTPGMLAAAVRPERNQIMVDLTGKEATTVRFTNSLPGPVTLRAPDAPGLDISIATPEIEAGKSTEVSIRMQPGKGSAPQTVTFTVQPTGQQIPIQIIYGVNNH